MQIINSYAINNIAEHIIDIIKKYAIEKHFVYLVSDNATNNDNCVKAISILFNLIFLKKTKNFDILGILSILPIKFFSIKKTSFTAKVYSTCSIIDSKKQLKVWHKKAQFKSFVTF